MLFSLYIYFILKKEWEFNTTIVAYVILGDNEAQRWR